jgi:hypothetical protein
MTYPNMTLVMAVKEQNGRFFSGKFIFMQKDRAVSTKTFAGVLDRDNQGFSLIEQGGGYDSGTLVGTDQIELIYRNDAAPYSIAVDSLKRV